MAHNKDETYVDLKNYNNIDQESKNLVSGYMKKIRSLLPSDNVYYNVPLIVNSLCALYYVLCDEWDPTNIGSTFEIDTDNPFILKKSGNMHQSAFLTRVVSDGKHCWTFKLINYVRYSLRFGIVFDKSICQYANRQHINIGGIPNTSYCWDPGAMGSTNWSLLSHKGDIMHDVQYGVKIKTGDTISVHLDLENLTLSFSVNSVNYGTAFNIKKEKYRCAVHMYDTTNVIELIRCY
eukprot:357942_1